MDFDVLLLVVANFYLLFKSWNNPSQVFLYTCFIRSLSLVVSLVHLCISSYLHYFFSLIFESVIHIIFWMNTLKMKNLRHVMLIHYLTNQLSDAHKHTQNTSKMHAHEFSLYSLSKYLTSKYTMVFSSNTQSMKYRSGTFHSPHITFKLRFVRVRNRD